MGSMDFLAARSLLGNQSVAPSVQVSRSKDTIRGTQTTSGDGTTIPSTNSNSHSHSNSKSSKGSHSRRHSRSHSWSKMMVNAAGVLCGTGGENISPVAEDPAIITDRGLQSEEMARLRPHEAISADEWRREEKFRMSGGGNLEVPDFRKGLDAPSPTPSATAEGVGIALSTSDDLHFESLSMRDHPYGTAYPHSRNAPTVSEQRRGSIMSTDYAGPHLSASIKPAIAANDLSTRHRLPPHATLHPYAQTMSSVDETAAKPRLKVDGDASQERPRQVADESRYGPGPSSPEGSSPLNHAYIIPNPNRDTKLSVTEVLRTAFGRPESQGSVSGGNGDQATEGGRVLQRTEKDVSYGKVSPTARFSAGSFDGASGQRIRRKPPPVMTELFSESTSELPPSRPGNPVQAQDLALHQTTSPSTELDTSKFRRSPSPTSNNGLSSGSSPAVTSPASSRFVPPTSGMDDLERFRDLFYDPNQPNPHQIADEADDKKSRSSVPSSGASWDVSSRSNRTASGLTSLARQLSQELEELNAVDSASQSEMTSGQRLGGLKGRRPPELSTDLHFVLSEMGRSRSNSPNGQTSPLHLPFEKTHVQPSPIIPEDVESSRASSPLEQPEDEDHTFGM
jgi:serine/arginine repetitive matrix protein 2